MASLLQKLLNKPSPSPFRILTSLTKPQLPYPTLSQFLHQNPDPNPNPFLPSLPDRGGGGGGAAHLQIYPSFPHWFHLGPIPLSGFGRSDSGEIGFDDEGGDRTVWADSVKKKRKRKMNKHKYRKLRKRLRRQT